MIRSPCRVSTVRLHHDHGRGVGGVAGGHPDPQHLGNQSAEVALIWEHISTTDLYVVEENYKGGTPYLSVSNE